MKRSKLGRTRYDAKACCAHKLPLFARMRLESPSNSKGRTDFRNRLLVAACYQTFPPKGEMETWPILVIEYSCDQFDALRESLVLGLS